VFSLPYPSLALSRVDPWECHQEAWLQTKMVLDHYQEVVSSDTEGQAKVKLLCGADLLESFATPGLWAPQDVR
jgi:nicotinic acid mononucleotide adenylyltransferase